MKTVKDYDKEINNLIAIRDSLEQTQSFVGGFAILLHDHVCRSNHTDQCGWGYEIVNGFHDWGRSTHKYYVSIAKEVIAESLKLKELIKELIDDEVSNEKTNSES